MDRQRNLQAMLNGRMDLLVIGGGITGGGIALDAAARGLKVALLERQDFGSGTSSKSSKLIHGGLRYLKQLQFKVTLDASREKTLLQSKLVPHLVQDTPFLFPLYGSLPSRAAVGAGLWIYDIAAGLPKGQIHEKLGPREALKYLPGLDVSRLKGAYLYHDARADDCRLVMHVVKKASDLGALVANRAMVRGFLYQDQRVVGVKAFDAIAGRPFEVAAKHVVNATGVWCDSVRQMEEHKAGRVVRPSKGVHLILPQSRVKNKSAIILQSPKDGRAIFLIPWGDRTVVGTTDTDYDGDMDHPRAESEDVQYLLDLLNEHLPHARVTRKDIISSYAGLRPLLIDGADVPSKASREHHIFKSGSGLITITGGKLTTYRRMAKQLVDQIVPESRCTTDDIPMFASDRPPQEKVPKDIAEHLWRAYGSEAEGIARHPNAAERLLDGLPYNVAEVEHAVSREMAVTVTDVLARRTRAVLFDLDQGRSVAERVAKLMARRLGWDAHEVRRQVGAYEEEIRECTPS